MNFFLFYHGVIFVVFNSVYFNFMYFLPNLWKGIEQESEEEQNHTLLCLLSDSFYFTVCTHSSLGFGDITPRSRCVRLITAFHMICVFVPFIIEYL